jgi:protein ImuA
MASPDTRRTPSPSDIAALRATLARLGRGGSAMPASRFGLGSRGVDGRLSGGLAAGELHEIVAAGAGDAGAASGFAAMLAARVAAERPGVVVWIVEDMAVRESGLPDGHGLAAHGLDPARLVLVRVPRAGDGLRAAEDALKARGLAAAIVEFAGAPKAYDLVASRRLLLAARAGGAPAFVLMTGAGAVSARLSSVAATRWEIAATASGREAGGTPGRARIRAGLVRLRGGLPHVWTLELDHERGLLREGPSLPLDHAAAPADRPAAAPFRQRADAA